MRGGVEGLRMDLVNGDEIYPPHPVPLPLGGGAGDPFASLECVFAILSSISPLKNATFSSSRGNEAQISSETEAISEPPHVGCYFLKRLVSCRFISKSCGPVFLSFTIGLNF